MRYIFFTFEDEKNWIEIDDNNIAYRQVILSDGLYHVSSLEDCLAEGQIIKDEIEADIIDISKKNFEITWNDALRDYRKIQAHAAFGTELSEAFGLDRTFMSVTTDLNVARKFAGEGGRVFEAYIPRSQLIKQTLSGAGESEYLIRFGSGGFK